MDMTEKINELQNTKYNILTLNGAPSEFEIRNLYITDYSLDNAPQLSFDHSRFLDINRTSVPIQDLDNLNDTRILNSQITGIFSTSTEAINPTRYIQLTQESYDSILNRISNLEESLQESQRGNTSNGYD